MTKLKKFRLLLVSFMLVISGFLFVACGNSDYSKTTLISSKDYIELFVGEENSQIIEVSIQNPVGKMDTTINYDITNPEVCELKKIGGTGYTTSYSITGLKGGNATINFVSYEGAKRTSVEVAVRQYSSTFTNASNTLFVSSDTAFIPTSGDFEFDNSATERGLDYYFFGQAQDNLTDESVIVNEQYVNNFVKVELIGKEELHLVFTDKEGKNYTNTKKAEQNLQEFVEVTKNANGDFVFEGEDDYVTVSSGDKFSFVAIYQNGNNDLMYCVRDFTILPDIMIDTADHGYGYKIKDHDYKSAVFDTNSKEIVLVPGYEKNNVEFGISNVTVSYVTAYLSVEIVGDENLLKAKPIYNDNILNCVYRGNSIIDDGKISYLFEINCATDKDVSTEFIVNFYYEGFDGDIYRNDESYESVNCDYSVSVEIKVVPLDFALNNISNIEDEVFYFYNHYETQSAGWKRFMFSTIPEGARYTELEINLTDVENIIVRYKGRDYPNETTKKLIITDLDNPIYIRGVEEATATNGEIGSIKVTLKFNLLEEDSLSKTIKYDILNGAKILTSTLNEEIYLDIHQGEKNFSEYFYADAAFSDISFACLSGEDVVSFVKDSNVCYGEINANQYLRFSIKPTKVGSGIYQISLDNGLSRQVTINVIEALDVNKITLQTTNKNDAVVDQSGNIIESDIINECSLKTKDRIKILNRFNFSKFVPTVDLQLIAYNDTKSSAIESVVFNASTGINIENVTDNGKTFDLSPTDVGLFIIELQINGYKIGDNFTIESNVISYSIHLAYMSYIQNLDVYKTCDGYNTEYPENTKASYVRLYTGTSNEEKRTARFEIGVENENAFGFFRDSSLYYKLYNENFVYWDYDAGFNDVFDFSTDTYTLQVKQNADPNKVYNLYAHISQFERTYTFVINITILGYTEVDDITLQNPLQNDNVGLSAIKTQHSFIAYAKNADATDSTIKVFLNNTSIDGVSMLILGDVIESDKKYQFTITLNPEFIEKAATEAEKISAKVIISAKDWLDSDGNIMPEKRSKTIEIPINYENGTENNRFTIESAEDFANIKNNPSAHYQVYSTVDITSITNQLPLGELKGSIIGLTNLSSITGIKISKSSSGCAGIFTEIAQSAHIKDLSFEGEIQINDSSLTGVNIGLIAGKNNGEITNIGVSLNKSSVTIYDGNVGGVVGLNYGTIKQDFCNLTENISPKTMIFMQDFLSVNATGDTYVGGLVGKNGSREEQDKNGNTIDIPGLIQKIDSTQTFSGYTNYMAYSLIRGEESKTNITIGGLVGYNNNKSSVLGQYWNIIGSNGEGKNYDDNDATGEGKKPYSAGLGIIVGGEVESWGDVSGVIGNNQSSNISGITARTFVRYHEKQGNTKNVSLIANYTSSSSKTFAIQAVDDGRFGEEASMLIIYSSNEDSYIVDLGKIAFSNGSEVMENAVFTYVAREYVEIGSGTTYVDYSRRDIYYGDAVVVSSASGRKIIAKQVQFTKEDAGVSVSKNDNLNNEMGDNSNVFYAFYFKVADSSDYDVSVAQNLFDIKQGFNKLYQGDSLYPFSANGDVVCISKTNDIISVDSNGTMSIKSTGLARLSLTSILNSSQSKEIYLYIVNYFDSVTSQSIIHPDSSNYSTPLDESWIYLRGNNSASIFVVPSYSFGTQINSYGDVLISGYAFNIAQNYDLNAEISVIGATFEEGDYYEDSEKYLNFENIGTETIITKGENIKEGSYDLIIKPSLNVVIGETKYYSSVNKVLKNVKVDYKFGAISIENKYYEEAVIFSNNTLSEEIIILTTDENEQEPKYTITKIDGNITQTEEDGNGLFNVDFKKNNVKSKGKNDQNIATIVYDMTVCINKGSDLYQNKYENDIYGDYELKIKSSSNSVIQKTIILHFEKTGVTSVVVDNYTSIKEIDEIKNLTSASEYAHPGVSGLLGITINPDDSDFDYILIENDDENYSTGHASANFGLVARFKNDESRLFTSEKIVGSATSNGIKLNLNDIINIYNDGTYSKYNGIVYIQYDFGSNNVVDESYSKIKISIVKDEEVFSVTKIVKIKLQNYVTVTLDGKDEYANFKEQNAYVSYQVARGLSYKLNINSYGFKSENISLVLSNNNLANIEKIGDSYYLNITKNSIDYNNGDNQFIITAIAQQTEGEETRFASSDTKITILEYVLNYNGEKYQEQDVVENMEGGVINTQVGAKITFGIDMLDFIEYDQNSNEIVNKINIFFRTMAQNGEWIGYTNLNSNGEVSGQALDASDEKYSNGTLQKFTLGKNNSNTNLYYTYSGLDLIPIRVNDPVDNSYYFTYDGFFTIDRGVYVYESTSDSQTLSNEVKTTFRLNVYTSSSEESPIPIYDYDDLTSMQSGAYYILLNNLKVPETVEFTPISSNFKSFDGNGHSITFEGNYDVGSSSDIGLFASLQANCVIKNLNVYYKSKASGGGTINFTSTTTDAMNFAGLVVDNRGSISNCKVYTSSRGDFITITTNSPLDSNSYVAGLVANNSGFITNSMVSASIHSNFNVAGFVGRNSGKIAASVFKYGHIEQSTDYKQNVGGFVVTNSDGGQIITSYVAGKSESTSINAINDAQYSYIKSTQPMGGFAYTNNGVIRDCYSNIDLSKTNSDASGFVYENGGSVKNCFSLSVLKNNQTYSTGFARFNATEESSDGIFENCYYYYSSNINISILQVSYDGIQRLNDDGFNNIDENFAGYAYSSSNKAVWFKPNGNTPQEFIDYIPTQDVYEVENLEDEENKNLQHNIRYNTQSMTFAKGRLELVSPNISTLSVRNFMYSEFNAETGNVTYYYIDDTNVDNRGSIHNPILLSSAENFENDLIERSSSGGLNTTNYRLINDIDYSSFEGLSQTYKITFAGIMEGNGMNISQISMASTLKLSNGGLLGQIGYRTNSEGIVKNLTISPRQVSFNNTTNVGALAGTLKYGVIYDINVEKLGESLTATGLNFVGGVIGKATTRYEIKDATSNINVTALHSSATVVGFDESLGTESWYSYAGGIVGFAGKGNVYNIKVNDITSVMGGRAGLAIGGTGKDSDTTYVYVEIPEQLEIKAYQFGGFVAGEISGNMKNVYVKGNDSGNNPDNLFSPFAVVPKLPLAVGGITGILSGGQISNAYTNQSFKTINNYQDDYVGYVGGIAGVVYDAKGVRSSLSECVVDSVIKAHSILGGAIGGVNSYLSIDSVAVKGDILIVEGKKAKPYLGGIVGSIAVSEVSSIGVTNAELIMRDSYCLSDLKVDTYTSGAELKAKVGGLIGGNENRSVKIDFCYTTSKIDAIIFDSRVVGQLTNGLILQDNYNQIENSETSNNINNTYYFGMDKNNLPSSDSEEPSQFISNFVTYQTKISTTSKNVDLFVTNYGKSSYSVGSDIAKEALNNLYVSTFKTRIGNSVETFNYNIAKDEYTTGDSVYRKDPNDSNIYRNQKAYVADTNFFALNETGLTYVYEGKEYMGDKANEIKLLYEGNTSDGKIKLRSSTGHLYEFFPSTTEPKVTVGGVEFQIKPSELIRYDQIEKSSLLQVLRYKAPNGDIYEQDMEVNDNDGYYKLTKGNENPTRFTTATFLAQEETRLNLKPIWKLNKNGFSTLAFEDNVLSWVNKV